MSVNKLPVELVDKVCNFLYPDDLPSILDLALASKRYHHIASPWFYRTIRFDIKRLRTRRRLDLDVAECSALLRKSASFHHVRRLIVAGNLAIKDLSDTDSPFPEKPPWKLIKLPVAEPGVSSNSHEPFRDLSWRTQDMYSYRLQYADMHYPSYSHVPPKVIGPFSCQQTYDLDEGWSKLASLMEQLPGLCQLDWQCLVQFPFCLLKVLHTKLPGCRLYIKHFLLRCLYVADQSLATDPHELDLISSPCLYQIRMKGYGHLKIARYPDGLIERGPIITPQAVMQMAAGIAPNLHEVFIETCRHHEDGYGWYERLGDLQFYLRQEPESVLAPLVPWNGFRLEDNMVCTKRLAPLTTLSLHGDKWWLYRDELEQWLRHTDCSSLRRLIIEPGFGINDKDARVLASTGRLESLNHLVITIPGKRRGKQFTSHGYKALGTFIHDQPHLSLLSVEYPPWHLLTKPSHLLKLLPPTLKSFHLKGRPVISSEDIDLINEKCPLLEVLEVGVKRSKGSMAESRCYQALGRFSKLRRLHLRLDVEFASPPSPELDGMLECFGVANPFRWRHPTNLEINHVRDWYINLAIDQTLARSILDRITRGSDYVSQAPALERSEIRTRAHFHPVMSKWLHETHELREIVTRLHHDWLFELEEKEERRFTLKDITPDYSSSGYRIGSCPFDHPMQQELIRIFKSVWPASEDEADPWHWKSFPLAKPDTSSSIEQIGSPANDSRFVADEVAQSKCDDGEKRS
ncbi:hypothetical protein QBC38DRAFT_530155 [Podospora fimiseda]|uniref:F-box domain-containing protein n=1 Tax=Podospora fimiseda TaxID=252190 RepID=A0AAN7BM74_9PEZI|nr:hypothetical protein QBC38DRAFT_530155 [Podospora fimiseda]